MTTPGAVAAVWIVGTLALIARSAWEDERGMLWRDGENKMPEAVMGAFLWPLALPLLAVTAPFFAAWFIGRWIAKRATPPVAGAHTPQGE